MERFLIVDGNADFRTLNQKRLERALGEGSIAVATIQEAKKHLNEPGNAIEFVMSEAKLSDGWSTDLFNFILEKNLKVRFAVFTLQERREVIKSSDWRFRGCFDKGTDFERMLARLIAD